jgi:hypothetical protein
MKPTSAFPNSHWPRRGFLKQSAALLGLSALPSFGRAQAASGGLTPPDEVRARVRAARPLNGGKIPANLKDILGTTHYDGRYRLTDKPYLVEGAHKIHELGMGVAKFWLHEDGLPGYAYGSDWGDALKGEMVDVLKHPYYREALALPFSTVMLEAFPLVGEKKTFFAGENDFADEERQFHDVASHLFQTYADRDITFILQHWEGDWMLRREEGGTWGDVPAAEVDRRCDAFIRFLTARQRGVDRARAAHGANSRCKVWHAAEVNRVWDGEKGLPTLTNRVLPHVTLDLVSWSSYDGMKDEVATWHGIEIIRRHMRKSPTFGDKAIYIGEIGMPERGKTREEAVEFWDRAMGVFLALEIPWVVHWELYCNEPADGTKPNRRLRVEDEMRGFWWLKPDGKPGFGGEYLGRLLASAGGQLEIK